MIPIIEPHLEPHSPSRNKSLLLPLVRDGVIYGIATKILGYSMGFCGTFQRMIWAHTAGYVAGNISPSFGVFKKTAKNIDFWVTRGVFAYSSRQVLSWSSCAALTLCGMGIKAVEIKYKHFVQNATK